jgi:hypothetical protein
MLHQANYHIYKLERGLTAADQRAFDQRSGEIAAALDGLRHQLAHSLTRSLHGAGVIGRMTRARKSTIAPLPPAAEF